MYQGSHLISRVNNHDSVTNLLQVSLTIVSGSLGYLLKKNSYSFFEKEGGIFQSAKSQMAAISHGESKNSLIPSTGIPVEFIFECIYVENGFIEVILVVFTI